MDYLELLTHSYEISKALDKPLKRLEFLAESILTSPRMKRDFITYGQKVSRGLCSNNQKKELRLH